MALKVVIVLVLFLTTFIVFVATRDDVFSYERSVRLDAAPGQIYPYLSHLSRGAEWSSYERTDPELKRIFSGEDGTTGSKLEFSGPKGGAGTLEIVRLVPDREVDERLTMTAPFKGESLIRYELTPDENGTRLTWTMSGQSGFAGKLMTRVFGMEKVLGRNFEDGAHRIATLIKANL